jgi:hypothetical protein
MAQSSHSASGKSYVPAQAVRATIAYRGQELRLVSSQTVAMRTLPSHELQAPDGQSGFWFQLEDAGGRVLYRRVMQTPIRYDTETVSDDPQRPLMRVALEDPDGVFFLLVPLLREAQIVRVFSSPLEPHKDAEPAREILAFDLFGGGGGQEPTTGPGTQPNRPRRRGGKKTQTDEEPDQDQGGEEA